MTGGKGIYTEESSINVTKEVGDIENKARWFCKPNIMHDALFWSLFILQVTFTHISWTLDSNFAV